MPRDRSYSCPSVIKQLEKEKKHHRFPIGKRVKLLYPHGGAEVGDTGVVTSEYLSISDFRCSGVRLDKSQNVLYVVNYILEEVNPTPNWEI